MSNSIGHNFLRQSLLAPTVLEHQSKINSSCTVGNTLFQVQASSQIRKSPITTEFRGIYLNVRKSKLPVETHRVNSAFPRAALATDLPSEQLAEMFDLDGNTKLQVHVTAPTPGSASQISIQVTNGSDPLVLHWGAIQNRKEKWVLPTRRPEGTTVYKNKALRSPFVKSDSNSFVKIEIDDPTIQAIEFLIVDEQHNKWFKNGDENFHVKLPVKDKLIQNISVPEDLVQIQAYIRWERKGKQMYTPQQEKVEYEAARHELLEEIARGTSIQDLRARITNKNNTSESNKKILSETKNQIPDDLVQIQAYVRWEKAGKPNYSPDQQLDAGDGRGTAKALLDKIAGLESEAQKSFMHRFNIAADLVDQAKDAGELGFAGILVWMRFMATRQLIWNKNYNVKPREISKAQDRLTDLLQNIYRTHPHYRELLRMILSTVGRGGEGDVGQRIRDEILVIQRNNDCKGGMMEEWHQKLHNNTSPDDVVICQALIDHIKSDFDVSVYWKTLNENGITKERLLSYDRGIHSEPNFRRDQKDSLLRDLGNYMRTLKAVHSGADLESAISNCMGYRSEGQGFMVGVKINPISGLPSGFPELLQFVLEHVEDKNVEALLEGLLEARAELRPVLSQSNDRLRDLLFLDIALDSCVRTAIERGYEELNSAKPEKLMYFIALVLENLALSSDDNEDLIYCLKAVHSGADLESAISNCMGYRSEGQGFMVGVKINPISGLPSGFPELLQFVLEHVEDKNVEALLEGLLEARAELRPVLSQSNDRLRDLLFLDIALDSCVRTAIERGYEELNSAKPEKLMYFIALVLENLALSSDDNEDLIYCLKGWNQACSMLMNGDNQWALYAKSVLDRTRLALASKAERYHHLLQPSAEYLGTQLGVDQWAVNIFTEEIIRAGSAASLSSLLNRLDPVLRETANLGSWQVISPIEAVGYVVVVDELLAVQNKSYEQPTILVAKSVKGEEEIPDGTVAVLTPDMPDVLSHVSVRARNSKVCFATCFDPNILADLQANEGKLLHLKPTSAEVVYSKVEGDLTTGRSAIFKEGDPLPSVKLVKKQFSGKYAISAEEFTSEMVGAKSRNIAYLKGKVPSGVGIPTSVALPFGVFENVISDGLNQGVAKKLQFLKEKLGKGDFSALGEIRKTVLELAAPSQLVQELKNKMQTSGMPWPGDEGQQRWDQAWMAIKKVWASKWNERAYFSTRKVKLDHDYLCMAVLVQEIINADYAFVIHTTNPSSGDSSEIYAEVVKGLGETLVGAYPGRALSFVSKKNNLNSPQVLGYPSKPIGLFIRRSIIFRSDSNGEDLEGYAGAGLYDSVPMDEEEKVVLDYSSDPLIIDAKFRQSILSSIACAGSAIEELYGSPQDIEGVVRDGKIYVVQTRPQM
ncbi:Alpha-glucan water dikinase [Actinidia chinensis var. chinensis]|uniref:alpha-glucan, water dikinase n=1 Tax=Actinidia chinensis var. chinensis TaxID=1590841 RepID=A0A2R6REQ7_ACTCC|nr:Alpha-glucan water dikinase [Actinidia chinensis var. chinensis]